jgi:hypothetical protein
MNAAMNAPCRPTWFPPGMCRSAAPVTQIHPEPNAGHRSVLVIPIRPSQGKAGRPRRPGRARIRAPITEGRRIAAGCRATPHQAISVLGSSCIVSLVIASCQEAQRPARPVWPGRPGAATTRPASALELGRRGFHRPGRAGLTQRLGRPDGQASEAAGEAIPGGLRARGWAAETAGSRWPGLELDNAGGGQDGRSGRGSPAAPAGPAEVFCLIMVLHAATRGQGVAG